DRTQRTTPPQRRYWPRKKQRSRNQAGRKKRCPGFAGKTTSSGRNTSTRKRKLSPAETARAEKLMADRAAAGGGGGGGVREGGRRVRVWPVAKGRQAASPVLWAGSSPGRTGGRGTSTRS